MDHLWQEAIKHIQISVAVIGFLANMWTLFVLKKTEGVMGKLLCILLQHQAVLDATVCAFAVAIMTQPDMWTTGLTTLDVIVCHIWHSQVNLSQSKLPLKVSCKTSCKAIFGCIFTLWTSLAQYYYIFGCIFKLWTSLA